MAFVPKLEPGLNNSDAPSPIRCENPFKVEASCLDHSKGQLRLIDAATGFLGMNRLGTHGNHRRWSVLGSLKASKSETTQFP